MKNIIFFIFGALLSGIIVWYVTDTRHKRAYNYLSDISTNANLEFYIKLHQIPESEVKCHISKMASAIAKEFENKLESSSLNEKTFGLGGLSSFTNNSITATLSEYETKQVKKYADTCIADTVLYYID